MKKQVLYLMLAYFSFCQPLMAAKKDAKPAWIDNPYAVCTKDEMCAVGTGERPNAAKADARSAIAKIFESRIKSSFENELSQKNDETTSKTRDYVSETSDLLIEAVEIKETYETPNEIYALAVLNKPVAARMVKSDMDNIDAKMDALLKETTPASAIALEKKYDERRALNRRYTVLTGHPKMENISYAEVVANKKAKIGNRHVFLVVKEQPNSAFGKTVRKVMVENGYTFAAKQADTTPVVTVSLTSEEQYFNVKGFVKFSYHFSLKGPDKKGRTIELLSNSFEETGRTEKQAFANALESLKQYLSENILTLSF